MRSLDEQTRELPRSLTPRRDLWPELGRRLQRRARARRAAMIAAVVAGVLVIAAVPTGHLLTRHLRDPAARAVLARFDEAAAVYERSRAGLVEALDALRGELGRASVERVKQDLGLIDRHLVEVRQALLRNPESGELASALAHQYARGLEVVDGTARLLTLPVVYVGE